MSDRDLQILKKMIFYMNEADSYIHHLNYKEFSQDTKTVAATAFMVGQIGELARKISTDIESGNPQIYWKGIRGMRNKIVHDYENIDLTILWDTIITDFPMLLEQIKAILQNE